VLSRLSKIAIVAALAGCIGWHWAILQSLAWAGMVISYAQDAPLKIAFLKTFDGRHPCALCKEIAKGRQAEKKSDLGVELQKFEFCFAKSTFLFQSPEFGWETPLWDDSAAILNSPPPFPPPRALPA
jgi:hypothetical protein